MGGVPLAAKINFETSPARGCDHITQINSVAENRASVHSSALGIKDFCNKNVSDNERWFVELCLAAWDGCSGYLEGGTFEAENR